MDNHRSCLSQCLDAMQSERASILVQGRALTEQEVARVAALEAAIAKVMWALSSLQVQAGGDGLTPPLPEPGPEPAPGEPVVLRDGRYTGANDEQAIELRVDEGVSAMISADVFQIGPNGERTWLASVRTVPGEAIDAADGSWEIVAQDQDGNVVLGELSASVAGTEPFTANVTLTLEQPATGIIGGIAHHFVATWRSETLRTLGLEVEHETAIGDEPAFERDGGDVVTIGSCLAEAGFARRDIGQPSEIPSPPAPGKWGTAQLHALMVQHAQDPLTKAKEGLHLLRLKESTLDGLLGIMFDSGGDLPRQGSAVFEEEIENFYPNDTARKTIQTTVHELGHALNLAHRFEREVGRADSLSFMNYDSRYLGGGREQDFWQHFDFRFDVDELAFLRHGLRPAVIPGGHDFHTVSYWSEGNGGYLPYLPEEQLTFITLEIHGPSGTTDPMVFDFLQPVFLEAVLTNVSGQSLELGDFLLDSKSGVLDIVVRRVQGDGGGQPPAFWVPLMQRCRAGVAAMAAVNPALLDTVANGQSMSRNLNLTFGAAGFTFAEPGDYDVQAVISLHNEQDQRNYIVPSNVLRVRIGYPHSRQDEEDALVMLREDVGHYLMLGGSRILDRARSDLEAVLDRRSKGKMLPVDGVCASIVRSMGIDAGRNYLLRKDGRLEISEGSRAQAADLLEKLRPAVLKRFFDSNTAEATAKLAAKHRKGVVRLK